MSSVGIIVVRKDLLGSPFTFSQRHAIVFVTSRGPFHWYDSLR